MRFKRRDLRGIVLQDPGKCEFWRCWLHGNAGARAFWSKMDLCLSAFSTSDDGGVKVTCFHIHGASGAARPPEAADHRHQQYAGVSPRRCCASQPSSVDRPDEAMRRSALPATLGRRTSFFGDGLERKFPLSHSVQDFAANAVSELFLA